MLKGSDVRLGNHEKDELLLAALPGSTVECYAGQRVVRFHDQVLLRKQVTYLGRPWPAFKKRIQIPRSWLDVHQQCLHDGLVPHFVGIYHHDEMTVFVDFRPSIYVGRRANNSAAHVAMNDLRQVQTSGAFSRTDARGQPVDERAPRPARHLSARAGGR